LEIGSRSFDVPAAKLVDLRNIDPSLPEPILVGVGSDVLRQLVWTIDYRTGTLLLTPQTPDATDRRHLQLISDALEVAARSPSYWQGFEFARRTNLFYRAGRWALLVNPAAPTVPPWRSYPSDWPRLPVPTLVRDSSPDLIASSPLTTRYRVAELSLCQCSTVCRARGPHFKPSRSSITRHFISTSARVLRM
jgi:hypothetical protein